MRSPGEKERKTSWSLVKLKAAQKVAAASDGILRKEAIVLE